MALLYENNSFRKEEISSKFRCEQMTLNTQFIIRRQVHEANCRREPTRCHVSQRGMRLSVDCHVQPECSKKCTHVLFPIRIERCLTILEISRRDHAIGERIGLDFRCEQKSKQESSPQDLEQIQLILQIDFALPTYLETSKGGGTSH